MLAATGPQRVAGGTTAGHAWVVDVVFVPNERTFEEAHPAEFPHGYDTAAPHAWYFFTIDGTTELYSDELASATGPEQPFEYPSDHFLERGQVYASAIVFSGVVRDTRIDHFALVHKTHTDTVAVVTLGDSRLAGFGVARDDPPSEIIAYDAGGKEIGRESGAQFAGDHVFAVPVTATYISH